jgi:hypothetical protein
MVSYFEIKIEKGAVISPKPFPKTELGRFDQFDRVVV